MTSQTHKDKIILIFIFAITYLLNIECPIHRFLGFYCPGCGVTRMLESILKLDFYQAFRYNSLIFIYLIIFILYEFYKLFCKIKNIKYYKMPNFVIYTLIVLAIIFGVLRNIDLFSWLAPTIVN